MEEDFIYCRHRTPAGIKVEEISGSEQRSGAVWRAMALQVYKENGRDGYRDIDHTESGAPLLYEGDERISVTHTAHLLAVATLAPTPGIDLEQFNLRTALGIDAEDKGRAQVLKVRPRFLSEAELASIPEDSVEQNILAWTVKEAVYKAALQPGLDLRDIRIESLPEIAADAEQREVRFGEASAEIKDYGRVQFQLYSYRSAECIVTLAWTAESEVFRMKGKQ